MTWEPQRFKTLHQLPREEHVFPGSALCAVDNINGEMIKNRMLSGERMVSLMDKVAERIGREVEEVELTQGGHTRRDACERFETGLNLVFQLRGTSISQRDLIVATR